MTFKAQAEQIEVKLAEKRKELAELRATEATKKLSNKALAEATLSGTAKAPDHNATLAFAAQVEHLEKIIAGLIEKRIEIEPNVLQETLDAEHSLYDRLDGEMRAASAAEQKAKEAYEQAAKSREYAGALTIQQSNRMHVLRVALSEINRGKRLGEAPNADAFQHLHHLRQRLELGA